MNDRHSRRDFLKVCSAIPLVAAAAALPIPTFAQDSATTEPSDTLKTSLNAYSFNKMLNDNLKHRGPGVTLLQVMDFAAKCGFQGFDPTGYFFPGYPEIPSSDYIKQLKQKAAELGLGISGSGFAII